MDVTRQKWEGGRGYVHRGPRELFPEPRGLRYRALSSGRSDICFLKSLEVGQARKEGRKKPRFIYSGSSLSVIFPPAKIDQFAFVVDVQPPPPRFLILFRNFRLWCTFPLSLSFSPCFFSPLLLSFFFERGGKRGGEGEKERKKAPRNDFETIPGSSVRSSRKPSNFSPPQVLFVSSTRAIDPASLSAWFTKRNDNAILIVPGASDLIVAQLESILNLSIGNCFLFCRVGFLIGAGCLFWEVVVTFKWYKMEWNFFFIRW